MHTADIIVVGAGAAGLMAAIQAARAARHLRVVALDGASRLGAKILISGGGRCNVTHREVSAADFSGSTTPAIARVLRQFDVAATVQFFEDLGVQLREEDTGKLFPVSNRAASVVDALLSATRAAGASLHHPCHVTAIERRDAAFVLTTSTGSWTTSRVIIASGGLSVPRTGSDGHGFAMVSSLGVPLTPTFHPALVPLTLPNGHWVRGLSGLSVPVRLTLRSGSGRHLRHVDGPMLCTHQGVSGPAALDVSRHWLVARDTDPDASLSVDWLPAAEAGDTDRALAATGRRACVSALVPLPERLVASLAERAGLAAGQPGATLAKDARKRLVRLVHEDLLPVAGTRGLAVAEVTAGGIPLAAVHLDRLESRDCPGLHVCGEICDVDGRLGGFNFQWAWASGLVAGRAAAWALGPREAANCVTIPPAT